MSDAVPNDGRRMKIAVPLFGDRVSPHFGASSRILVIEALEGRMIHRGILHTGRGDGWQLARHLAALEIDVLVCNGIQRKHKEWLRHRGIEVLDNRRGAAEDLVTAFIISGR